MPNSCAQEEADRANLSTLVCWLIVFIHFFIQDDLPIHDGFPHVGSSTETSKALYVAGVARTHYTLSGSNVCMTIYVIKRPCTGSDQYLPSLRCKLHTWQYGTALELHVQHALQGMFENAIVPPIMQPDEAGVAGGRQAQRQLTSIVQ